MTYAIGDQPGSRGVSASGRVLERTAYGTLKAVRVAVDNTVESRSLSTPPLNPSIGARWVVKAPAAGAWVGKEDKIAVLTLSGWQFEDPKDGTIVWAKDEDVQIGYTATTWVALGVGASGSDVTFNTYKYRKAIRLPDGTDPTSIVLGGFYIIKNPANAGGLTGDVYVNHVPGADPILDAMQQIYSAADPSIGYIRVKASGVFGTWKATSNIPARLNYGDTITNCNTVFQFGVYSISPNTANMPPSLTAYVMTLQVLPRATDSVRQIAWAYYDLQANSTDTWQRDHYGGTWGPWYKVGLSQTEMDARYVQIGGSAGGSASSGFIVGKSDATFAGGFLGAQPFSGTGLAVNALVSDTVTAARMKTQVTFTQISSAGTLRTMQFSMSPALPSPPTEVVLEATMDNGSGTTAVSVSSITASGFVGTASLTGGADGSVKIIASVYA